MGPQPRSWFTTLALTCEAKRSFRAGSTFGPTCQVCCVSKRAPGARQCSRRARRAVCAPSARLARRRTTRVLVAPRRAAAARRLAGKWVERAGCARAWVARANRAESAFAANDAVLNTSHHRQRCVLVRAAWAGKRRRCTRSAEGPRRAGIALRSATRLLVGPRHAAHA